MSLLQVKNLSVSFHTDNGRVNAVDGLDFKIEAGKTLCMVGESGCGKSVTALSILRLIQSPPGVIESGSILFNSEDLLQLPINKMRQVRGNRIAMIFQDPMTSLNPVFTIGSQIMEALILHQNMSRKEARERTIEMLTQVRIPDAHRRIDEYPHQMSGGMRQRVMIAMALSCNPELLIADEPTTALDVTIQAQILDLLAELQEKRNMAVLFITHDLGIVARIADQVIVLYAGRAVERGTAADIFHSPRHPYTKGLLASVPRMEHNSGKLAVIPGTLPNASEMPEGCRFYNRCERRSEVCLKRPLEENLSPTHSAACFNMESSHAS
ncbi:MAG: ABC transporter ATP-binding protein [Fibrobacteres bacterium]|nr:ABC transporter ATP-binding protein [Fibrobacterota bacterium]